MNNPPMCVITNLLCYSFALPKHTFTCHLHIIARIHSMLISSIICLRVETVTPEQEEGEPEPVGDDASFVNQGKHLCILYSLFWIK